MDKLKCCICERTQREVLKQTDKGGMFLAVYTTREGSPLEAVCQDCFK